MNVSIIVPTHNRSRSLEQAVRSALSLNYPTGEYEVIVVDNAGTDATRDIVQRLQAESYGKNLRYVPEPRVGLHYARHAGARAAAGEILVFTDDDATFDAGWIQAYAAAFAAHPEMIAAGGPVRPVWEVPPPQWLLEVMDGIETPWCKDKVFCPLSLMEPYEEFRLEPRGFLAGVNMAVRRSVFDWTGFHPELFGTRTIGDGESGLLFDIVKRGGLIGYVPAAVVHHHIPVRRMTVKYIRTWAWHFGGAEMYGRWWQQERSHSRLMKEAVRVAQEYWRAWVKDMLVRHRSDPAAITTQFYASLGWCKLRYVWWMLTDTQVRAMLDVTDFRP